MSEDPRRFVFVPEHEPKGDGGLGKFLGILAVLIFGLAAIDHAVIFVGRWLVEVWPF
jgi:hypothetical protein